MNITLLLTGIAVLDVLMMCYSFHLDRQIAKLRDTSLGAVDNDPPARIGRFERFVHSPLGITVLVLGFVGALILVREADRRQENRNIGQGIVFPKTHSYVAPFGSLPEASSEKWLGVW
jgi:hypothetical protein